MPDQSRADAPKENAPEHTGAGANPAQPTPVEPIESSVSTPIKIEEAEARDIGAHGTQEQVSIADQALVDRINRSDRWMIALTAVIAVGGALSAFLFWKHLQAFEGQLEAMRGQLEEMKSTSAQTDKTIAAFERLADAAKETADANRNAVQIANETARRQLRAYVIAEFSSMRQQLPDQPIFEIKIKNTGLTPANRLDGTALVVVVEFPFLNGRMPVWLGTSRVTRTIFGGPDWRFGTLGPNQEAIRQIVPPRMLTEEDIDAVSKEGNKRLLAVGAIYYTDVFGVEHVTRICLMSPARSGVSEGEYCPEHNDAN